LYCQTCSQFIEEDTEEHSSGSDDDSTSDINEIGDAAPIDSLNIEDQVLT
jgi:hypothetical protein